MPQDASTDERTTVGRSPVGDAAFTEVFVEHYDACLRTARRLVRDQGLAHDVVQDVFLSWWRSGGGGYRPELGELGPWLSTLTHHKAVDALRRADRQRRTLASVCATLLNRPEDALLDDVVWWRIGEQSLLAALPTLPPKQQEVLRLAYTAGLSQVEIADRLGIPLGTVKSRTHAGMLRLRAALSGTWTPTGPVTDLPPDTVGGSTPAPQVRSMSVAPDSVPAGSTSRAVEACAAALLRIAAEEAELGRGAAAMLRRAAALVDEHGDAAAYDLIVALARSAASASATSGCDGARTAREAD